MPRLTDASVRALPPPERGVRVHFDDVVRGFGVRCSQGGSRSYVLQFGTDRRMVTISKVGLLGLAEARTAAKRLLAEHTLGKHRAPRIMYSEALRGYLEDRGRHNRPRTMKDTTRILNRYFGSVRGKQLEAITTHELTRIMGKLANGTPGTARHAFSEARAFFRWCVKHRYIQHSPLEGIDPPVPIRSRERVLSDDELRAIWSATDAPTDYNTVIRICMLTGLRRGEATRIEPSWLKDGVLTIPYRRLGKRALRLANRYAYARQMRRARREIRRLKTFLGRVARDIGRKIANRPGLAPHFAEPLARVTRLLAQQKTDHAKLYALHAPEVECLAKSLPLRKRGARRTSATSSASRSRSPPPIEKGSCSA